jgi:hypothetical protein
MDKMFGLVNWRLLVLISAETWSSIPGFSSTFEHTIKGAQR